MRASLARALAPGIPFPCPDDSLSDAPRKDRRPPTGAHDRARTAHQSAAIGALHGLGGTGAIVLLLATKLPSTTDALLALAIFAPMSVLSMALCTALYGRVLIHPTTTRAVPVLALTSLAFGAWYAS